MLRSTVPTHPDANSSLHSISIGPASAARAASSKSLYRKRARASCSRHPLRRKRASDKALRLIRSWQPTESNGYFRIAHNPDVIAHGYFGTVDGDSENGILRPASVYSPKKRIVAIASKETGTHIPFSCANCIVR